VTDPLDSPVPSVLVCIPTYDEAANLQRVVSRVRTSVPGAHVLVTDDNSPDGTGILADRLAAEDDQVHVLHRSAKAGLGAAYLSAFGWALDRGYDVIVEMDADGSHRPEELPALLAEIEAGADLVLGSRWVAGGRVVNWPRSREVISRGGNTYARLALGLSLRDATGGYRAFRAATLKGLDLASVESQGYCFQVDLARRAVELGYSVKEVPITFVEREAGVSKMTRGIVGEAFWRVTLWGAKTRWAQVRAMGRKAPEREG
jgi:dolichol-phosphate mannosyltransferase